MSELRNPRKQLCWPSAICLSRSASSKLPLSAPVSNNPLLHTIFDGHFVYESGRSFQICRGFLEVCNRNLLLSTDCYWFGIVIMCGSDSAAHRHLKALSRLLELAQSALSTCKTRLGSWRTRSAIIHQLLLIWLCGSCTRHLSVTVHPWGKMH